MTLLNILGDGTIYPPLRANDLVIMLAKGNVEVGIFSREKFLELGSNYIQEPLNRDDLLVQVVSKINEEMPQLYEKKHVMHILCPASISNIAEWETALIFDKENGNKTLHKEIKLNVTW